MARRRRPLARGWEHAEIFAIGHSTHTAAELIELLQAHGIATVADVRTVPRSRTNPQFNSQPFAKALARAGIRYVHMATLGGLRRPQRDSPNRGWHNRSFQGFADYMGTPAFLQGLEELRRESKYGPVVLLCAEALRWRCHRSLIADALFARGVIVQHIESRTRTRPHVPTPFAHFRGMQITYPVSAALRVEARRARASTLERSPRSSLQHS
jgi:uncharacterized protein (DUF488 family)